MILLHISDLHFAELSDGSCFDIERNFRAALLRDCEKLVGKLRPIDLVIVSGDIAQSGKAVEFAAVTPWLQQIGTLTKAGYPHGFRCVPGNHDVDNEKTFASPELQRIQNELRTCWVDRLDAKLGEILVASGPATRELLYAPLADYNEFARTLGCDISASRPYWETDSDLGEGYSLRVRGLNSTLNCNYKIDSERADNLKMVIGAHQLVLDRSPGRLYALVCHHPPSWTRAAGEFDALVTGHTSLQLFGHEHSAFFQTINNTTLRMHAGAVQPERSPGYLPSYNLISLGIRHLTQQLEVRAYFRAWSNHHQSFVPHSDHRGRAFNRFLLRIPPEARLKAPRRIAKAPQAKATRPKVASALLYVWRMRFRELSFHGQMEIARHFGVAPDSPGCRGESLFEVIVQRLEDPPSIKELTDEITRHERQP